MANRRMFAKSITKTGKFLMMPMSARLLYYDLGMDADDDGVVEAFSVMRMTGSSEDDLRILVAKGYITILDDDLLAYINDWNVNNFIRSDRYTPSIHQNKLKELAIPVRFTVEEDEKPALPEAGIPDGIPDGIPTVYPGKDRLESSKDSKGKDTNTNKVSKADLETEFEELWKLYPRKREKERAKKAFIAARKKGTTYEEVLNGINAYKAEIARTRKDLQYVKYGSSWFNGHCWEDEYTEGNPAQAAIDDDYAGIRDLL